MLLSNKHIKISIGRPGLDLKHVAPRVDVVLDEWESGGLRECKRAGIKSL